MWCLVHPQFFPELRPLRTRWVLRVRMLTLTPSLIFLLPLRIGRLGARARCRWRRRWRRGRLPSCRDLATTTCTSPLTVVSLLAPVSSASTSTTSAEGSGHPFSLPAWAVPNFAMPAAEECAAAELCSCGTLLFMLDLLRPGFCLLCLFCFLSFLCLVFERPRRTMQTRCWQCAETSPQPGVLILSDVGDSPQRARS